MGVISFEYESTMDVDYFMFSVLGNWDLVEYLEDPKDLNHVYVFKNHIEEVSNT